LQSACLNGRKQNSHVLPGPAGGFRRAGKRTCQHVIQLLLDEGALARGSHGQMIHKNDGNVDNASYALANRPQRLLQKLGADAFAGRDLQHDLAQGVLIVLILSDDIGVILAIETDDRDRFTACTEDKFLRPSR